jgi:hypothetical protein
MPNETKLRNRIPAADAVDVSTLVVPTRLISQTGGSGVEFASGPALDAFGRLRVSDRFALFESKMDQDDLPLLWAEKTAGAGTSIDYTKAKACVELSVAATTVASAIRQSIVRPNYQPGNSHLGSMTGSLGAGASGITAEIGMHDDDNGVFFRSRDGVVEVVVRSSTSGSVVDNAIPQTAWNRDKLDGDGPSGVVVTDWSKITIFEIDTQWLGAGNVRFGISLGGRSVVVHEESHSLQLDAVYMSTPNLPVRYRVSNDGSGPAYTIIQVCASVASEGGQTPFGIERASDLGLVPLAANLTSTVYALIGIMLKSTHLARAVSLLRFGIFTQGINDDLVWRLFYNPIIAGSPTWTDQADSAVQTLAGVAANTITNGHVISAGYVRGDGSATIQSTNLLQLGSDVDGTPTELVVGVQPVAPTTNVYGSQSWLELV